ncbi:MAG: AEC family transporter [Clostridia bacterium]|nr:AEC family transporter [Clostridia bacterium]
MEVSIVLNQVLILFIILIVGYIANKLKIISDDLNKKLSNLIVKITMPAIILVSTQIEFSKENLTNTLWILVISFTFFIISILVSQLLYRNSSDDRKPVLKFATSFSNCGYMGFPILYGLFGDIGIFYGAIFQIPFNIFIWTYGVIIFKKHNDVKQMLKDVLNPSIIALFLGFILMAFNWKIPDPFYSSLNYIGGLTTPLSMLVIGATLGTIRLREVLKDKMVYIVSLLRLILIPVLCYFSFVLFNPPKMALTICVLLLAMPSAAATTIFAQEYNGNAKLAAGVVSFSTFASLLTIPLMMYLVV